LIGTTVNPQRPEQPRTTVVHLDRNLDPGMPGVAMFAKQLKHLTEGGRIILDTGTGDESPLAIDDATL
jgi:hypothetical protein